MKKDHNSIAAIIVTFNRKELLKEAIEALLNQEKKLDEIIIVNNCSTDGTEEVLKMFEGKITVLNLKVNIGGAGGFNEGLKYAYEKGHSLFWIMDDDTIVKKNSLEEMTSKLEQFSDKNIGYLCSNVVWVNNEPCIMNKPEVSENFNELLLDGLVKVKSCSFVSVLIRRKVIEKCGYPIKEFFIWMDDTEFTLRADKYFNNYMVINSVVTHKMAANVGTNIIKDDSRLGRYFYDYRNRFYLAKKNGIKSVIKYIYNLFRVIINIMLKSKGNKVEKLKVILSGVFQGIFFNPKIERVKN